MRMFVNRSCRSAINRSILSRSDSGRTATTSGAEVEGVDNGPSDDECGSSCGGMGRGSANVKLSCIECDRAEVGVLCGGGGGGGYVRPASIPPPSSSSDEYALRSLSLSLPSSSLWL